MNKLNYVLLAVVLLVLGCEKDVETENDEKEVVSITQAQTAIEDYIKVSEQFKNAVSSADEAEASGKQLASSSSKSLNIAQDTVIITITPFDLFTFPKTIVADFGTGGILGPDFVTRKGKITSTINNWGNQAGSIRNTTFDNYFHNSCQIIGNVTTENLGSDNNENAQYKVNVEDGKYICAIGDTIHFTRESALTQIAGQTTELYIWDDEFTVDAIEECITSQGIKLTITTTETLVYSTLTKVKSGILSVEIENFILPIVINYNTNEITIGLVKIPF